MTLSRRDFLTTAAAVTAGFAGFRTFIAGTAYGEPDSALIAEGLGPLISDPNRTMDLPQGFNYQIISTAGDEMTDGFLVPHKPDGMATFPGLDGRTILIRNHELSPDKPEWGAFGATNELLAKLDPAMLYDSGHGKLPCLGGTTTVVYNTRERKVECQFLSLAGTGRNCAGGPTPWNSWVSCEETVQRADDAFEKDHGYNFEVPASASIQLVKPVALKEMGRFNHEAVAIDPRSGIVYQTEDRDDGLLYRYIPNEPGELVRGGKLQALCIRDQAALDTRNWGLFETAIKPGQAFATSWINLDDIESPNDDLRHRGCAAGAARFARGEGMWYGHDAIYFACTNGGAAKAGQIWRYTPSPSEGSNGESSDPGKLELFIEPNNGALVENADNLTIAPWGDIVVCEDGNDEQFVVGVTPQGKFYQIARNAKSDSELAGATFSPDGTTLFVNIQHEGLTIAITGPWRGTA